VYLVRTQSALGSADRRLCRLISKYERRDQDLRPIQVPQAKDRGRSVRAHAALRIWNWRLGRVYFLAFLNPSRGQPDPALTARLASLASVGEPAIEFD